MRDLRTARDHRSRPEAGRGDERRDRAPRTRPRRRRLLRSLRPRVPAPLDHRPGHRRSARRERARRRCGRLQRRDLQLQGAAARAGGEGARDPRHRRLAARSRMPTRSGAWTSSPAWRGCSRSPSGTAPPNGSSSPATGWERSRSCMRCCRTARLPSPRRRRRCCGCPSCRASSIWRSSTRTWRSSTCRARGSRRSRRCRRARSPSPRGARCASSGTGVRCLPSGEGDWVERVRSEVTAAVRRRLVADVPLGALLSGGLDSSIVVAAMAGASAEPVRTFTIGFPDRPLRRAAVRARRRRAIRHARTRSSRSTPSRSCSSASRRPSTSRSATRRRCRRCSSARRRGAASPWRSSATAATRHSGATSAIAPTRSPGGCHGSQPPLGTVGARRGTGCAAAAAVDPVPRAALPRRGRAAGRRALRQPRRGLPARAAPRAVDGRGARPRRRRRCSPHDPDLRVVDIESYLPGDLLPKADIASMAVSLELRAPFLDHRVVELGLALPAELARGKAALRQAFAADLPPEIAARAKTGFGVPLDRWFRGELAPARRGAPPRQRRDRGLFRRPVLERLLREHADRRRRPRPPPLVPLHAGALAATLRRRPGAPTRLAK